MYDDELAFGLGLVAFFGWAFFFIALANNGVTELPNDCILYEEKIWCEVEE